MINRFTRHPSLWLLIIVAIIFVAVVSVAEILLAKTPGAYHANTVTRYIRLREHLPGAIHNLDFNDELLKRLDNKDRINSRLVIEEYGYIYPSIIHKNPDINIVFLGGSTTECFVVEEKKRFPYLVGRLLESSGVKINSINSGRSGNHSMHSTGILLHKIIEHEPDIVVMMHNVNDLITLVQLDTYWNNNSSRSLLVQNDASTSVMQSIQKGVNHIIPNLYSNLSALRNKIFPHDIDEFAHVRHKKNKVDITYILRSFKESLETYVAIAKTKNIIPVLMTQANRFKDPEIIEKDLWKSEAVRGLSFDKYGEYHAMMNDVIRQVAHSQGILLIDLDKEIPSDIRYMYDTVHYNTRGSVYVANIISRYLRPIMQSINSKT